MNRIIKSITSALLIILCSASCSRALLSSESIASGTDYRLVIIGKVSEQDSHKPLKGIRITFRAYPTDDSDHLPIVEQTVTTDDMGVYIISSNSYSSPVVCTIMAEDISKEYDGNTSTMTVNWSGPSFVDGTFYINDLNLALKKCK